MKDVTGCVQSWLARLDPHLRATYSVKLFNTSRSLLQRCATFHGITHSRLATEKIAHAGDVWNVMHSLMRASSILGMDIFVGRPRGYEPNPNVVQFAKEQARMNGSKRVITDNLEEAIVDGDVVYANTWHSTGRADKEKEKGLEISHLTKSTKRTTKNAKRDFFMHCHPWYRGEEMSDGRIEGLHSVVWEQAENRMHTEKRYFTSRSHESRCYEL